jgi:DNA-binding HxlR family transcriptional regulator
LIGAKVDAEEEENMIVDVGSIEEESKVKYKLKVKGIKLKEDVKTDKDWKNIC